MLGPDRIRPVPCVSSCELCTEPSGSPASGFQDSMRTLAEAVTKGCQWSVWVSETQVGVQRYLS